MSILNQVADRIRANPDGYDQTAYARRCDDLTAFCIAGHICIADGLLCREPERSPGFGLLQFFTPDGVRVLPERHARDVAGLEQIEAFELFRHDFRPPGLRDDATTTETAEAVADYLETYAEFI